MTDLPKFALYGEGDPRVEERIQPRLAIRAWSDLTIGEKTTALQELKNAGWLNGYSRDVLATIHYLNAAFLRICPGNRLHRIPFSRSSRGGDNEHQRREAAFGDFEQIFLEWPSDDMVLRMISKFAERQIDLTNYKRAEDAKKKDAKDEYIKEAFANFDRLTNCLNHIFEQFSVNVMLTRNGLIPRQDDKITEQIYEPTLKILSDPKWNSVDTHLADMFQDYQDRNYPEVITKAHGVVQRFLQILVGEEGKGGKGEIGKLFSKAKKTNAIPVNRFTEPLLNIFQGFIVSERATNSTAKPALNDATPSDALLVMNVVMVFLQHCLQKDP